MKGDGTGDLFLFCPLQNQFLSTIPNTKLNNKYFEILSH